MAIEGLVNFGITLTRQQQIGVIEILTSHVSMPMGLGHLDLQEVRCLHFAATGKSEAQIAELMNTNIELV